MIIVVHRVTESPGKRSEAEDFFKRFDSWLKKQTGVEDSITFRPLQGPKNRIMRSTRFSSLAAFGEYRKKRAEDPEFQALMKELGEKEYIVPNTLERYVHEVVE